MEELSTTERLILTYIKSHPPEECMLDKITRGTSRSRATVLKYLDILHAKGILSFKFVGRSKLWYLSPNAEDDTESIIKHTEKEVESADELASIASKLHSLKLQKMDLKRLINTPDKVIFTINNHMDIISANDTFYTFFKEIKNFKELLNNKQRILIENIIDSLDIKDKKLIELDLIEKQGLYRPYSILMQPILDHKTSIIGISLIGEEISSSKRTKRDLETLLSIVQATDSSENEENVIKEIKSRLKSLIPYKHFAIFFKDGERLDSIYKADLAFSKIIDGEIPAYITEFIEKSMNSMETITSKEGDYYLEAIKSNLNDELLNLAISIPLIDEENAKGAILLLTILKSISSISIENIEIAADELSGYLKIQRLTHEREEFANTLIAMNKISNIINSSEAEDEMLEKSISAVISSLGFEMGCIYLSNVDEELSLRVHKNLPENLRKMCIEGMFKDLFSATLEKRNVVYITPESEEYKSLDPAIKANGIKTLLILPIKSGKDIIGILNMGSTQKKTYNNISLENLSSIGLQLGVALEKSRLAIKLDT